MPGPPGPGVASKGNWLSSGCSEPVVTMDCLKSILQCHIQKTGFPGNSLKGSRTSPFRLNLRRKLENLPGVISRTEFNHYTLATHLSQP